MCDSVTQHHRYAGMPRPGSTQCGSHGKRRARHTGPAPARMAPGAHQRTGQAARQHLRGLQHAPRACVLRALPHRHHLPARAGTLANRQGLRACGRRTLRPAARRAAREGRDCTTWQARSRNAACCRPMSSWSASAAIAPPPPPPAPTAAAAAGTCGTGPLRRWPLESFGAVCTARARIQRERTQAASPSSGRVMLRAVRAARRPHQARRRRRRAQQRQQGGWRRDRCGVQANHAVMTDLRACRRVCAQHVAAGSQT